uniref:Uncharacterized protein n=1 Tax=Tree climacium moss associated tymo-like virus TaxID=2933190 RepID=A0A9C7GWQ1_9VIRU|nr:hypothetical protein [Tree climacium moss associated tymo-like virus]CAI5384010.1 hypothetical protein [Tree climacium moss associated tymo-like virus]
MPATTMRPFAPLVVLTRLPCWSSPCLRRPPGIICLPLAFVSHSARASLLSVPRRCFTMSRRSILLSPT